MSASAADQDSHEALAIWDANATHWDKAIGHEGNHYWKRLQRPCLGRLLARQLEPTDQPRRALELACGNGLCSRWLAGHGDAIGEVWATDGSASMVDRARAHGSSGGRIVFRKLDVTCPEDFTVLLEEADAEAGFDIVLMNMALMDVSDLEPLAAAVPKLLRRDGVFVATVLHPVFMTSDYSRDLRYRFDAETGGQTLESGKTIFGYMDVPPVKSVIFSGHETSFVSFHRPIHELLGPFFRAGLVVDALEEPSFGPEDENPERPHSTVNFPQLPPIMAFRLRRSARVA